MFGSSTITNIVPKVSETANATFLDGGTWYFVTLICGILLAVAIISVLFRAITGGSPEFGLTDDDLSDEI